MRKQSTTVKDLVATTEQAESKLLLIHPADELLTRYQPHLNQLRQLISVTKADYHNFYLELIKTVAVFVQQLPSLLYSAYEVPYGLFTLALERMVAALKYRRAYMLPIGADTETCYKQQDAWTYALFTAALLKDIGQVIDCFEIKLFDRQLRPVKKLSLAQPFSCLQAHSYRFMPLGDEQRTGSCNKLVLIKTLLPEAGLTWLKSHTELFKAWEDCLTAFSSTRNVLIDIITQVEARLTNSAVVNTACSQQSSIDVNEEKTETVSETLPKTEVILQAENTIPLLETSLTLPERFIDWLKQAIAASTVNINQREGLLHHVAEGILIVMPAAYEQFQLYQENKVTVLTKRDKHRFLKELLATEFVVTKSYQTLPRYHWGHWHDRQLIEGILIVPTILFQADKLPPLNPHLQVEPDLDL